MSEELQTRVEDRVGQIIFNRPETRNGLVPLFIGEVMEALKDFVSARAADRRVIAALVDSVTATEQQPSHPQVPDQNQCQYCGANTAFLSVLGCSACGKGGLRLERRT